jgi:hypothetical protein
MGKDSEIRQDVESSLAAVQRLRDHRDALLEEIREIDQSLERIHSQISEILGSAPAALAVDSAPARTPMRKAPKKDGELTVDEAVLQVILEARKDLNKSDIRIRAMRLIGPFSESALNAALSHWVDEEEIRNTSRGYYASS